MKLSKVSVGPRLARAFFLAGAALCCTVGAHAAGLEFDKTFNDKGDLRQIHFLASYTLEGKSHEIEVWRDRDRQLRRRTDQALETFVVKPARENEWHMVVLDLQRKIRTDVDRTNLYRIGHFTDWFGMAHGLTRPTGAYQLSKLEAEPGQEKPVAACTWYALTRAGSESRICWSPALHLPLLVLGRDGAVQWRVTRFDKGPLPKNVFQVHDQGFVRNDANEDIKGD